MKNITLSAEENLIEQARQAARVQRRTLNQMFREWLSDLASRRADSSEYKDLMRDIRQCGAMAGRNFSREEMNQR